jgi:hypothetical protein
MHVRLLRCVMIFASTEPVDMGKRRLEEPEQHGDSQRSGVKRLHSVVSLTERESLSQNRNVTLIVDLPDRP